MNNALSNLFLMSRPRFWMYVTGPFLIGAVAANPFVWMSAAFWILLIYFLFPANVLLYGVNDYYDKDTDKYSQKKRGKEFVFSDQQWVFTAWVSCLVIGLALGVVTHWTLILYLLLGIGYSAEPVRFKRRPFLDSLSNVLYIIPGIFAYLYFGGSSLNWSFVLAGAAWSAAMHLYSAVPDISADKQAGLQTTAVVLGKQNSLVLCALLWWLAALLSGFILGYVYVAIAVYVWMRPQLVEKVYWYFPYLNAAVGFSLFVWVIL